MTLRNRPFENILGKEENAGNQHFLLFPECFLVFKKRNFIFWVSWSLSSANAVNLDRSEEFGKELKSFFFLILSEMWCNRKHPKCCFQLGLYWVGIYHLHLEVSVQTLQTSKGIFEPFTALQNSNLCLKWCSFLWHLLKKMPLWVQYGILKIMYHILCKTKGRRPC